MFVALVAMLSASSPMPKIAIEQAADGYIAKVAEFDARIQVDVDAEIARRAADICKGKQVRWGKFSSLAKLGKIPGSEPAPVTGYVHEFSCVPNEQATYEPAPADWKPSASDETEARTFFQTYYARRDSGEFGAALNMFASSMRSEPAKWSDEMRGFNASLGAGKRRVTGVTWYVNPEQSEHPGIYAAVDFVGDYAKAYFYCGYLALYRRGPGDYEIVREEQNRFMRADSQTEPEQLAQMRATMCRGQ